MGFEGSFLWSLGFPNKGIVVQVSLEVYHASSVILFFVIPFSFFFIFNQIAKMTITHATSGRLKESAMPTRSGWSKTAREAATLAEVNWKSCTLKICFSECHVHLNYARILIQETEWYGKKTHILLVWIAAEEIACDLSFAPTDLSFAQSNLSFSPKEASPLPGSEPRMRKEEGCVQGQRPCHVKK